MEFLEVVLLWRLVLILGIYVVVIIELPRESLALEWRGENFFLLFFFLFLLFLILLMLLIVILVILVEGVMRGVFLVSNEEFLRVEVK